MSTFSGLGTALSSLIAQRQALDVTGQNIANASTPGYTRQRADLESVRSLSAPSMHSSGLAAGNGVRMVGLTRIGDVFLDARVHAETSTASFQKSRATTLARLESTLTEPADTGVAASLQKLWAGWQDVANRPDDAAARKVLLGDAATLVHQISAGYRGVETQWSQMRTAVDTLTTEINETASAVAHLNEQIRSILVSGGSANELIDQRALHVTKLSALVGATARHREDGTTDVMVGGNALVRGVNAQHVRVDGPYTMSGAVAGEQVRLVWDRADGSDITVALEGGRLAGHVADLAPDGPLTGAASAWDVLATDLATKVNAIHGTGITLSTDPAVPGSPAGDFFSFEAGPPAPPAAVGLRVAITDPTRVAAGASGQGPYDGSVADAISQLAHAPDGPDVAWRSFVVDLGVRTRSAEQRATVSEAARGTAENLQLSQASVDLDEETVQMLAHQRAYEGAARVLTAVDEMLDVLINRTGVVGR